MDAYGGIGTGVVLLLWLTLLQPPPLRDAEPALRASAEAPPQQPVGHAAEPCDRRSPTGSTWSWPRPRRFATRRRRAG